MNVGKPRVSYRRGRHSDKFALEGCSGTVALENVLDLLVVVEDERRFHSAAALLTEDPVDRARCRAMARDDSALLANIRHDLARGKHRRMSRRERARQLELYAYRLMAGSQRPRRYALVSTTNIQGGE